MSDINSDVINLVISLPSSLLNLWHFYLVVLVAILGWIFTKGIRLDKKQKCIVISFIIIIAVVNLCSLLDNYDAVGMVYDLIENSDGTQDLKDILLTKIKLAKKIGDSSFRRYHLAVLLHLILDFAVISIVLFHNRESKK